MKEFYNIDASGACPVVNIRGIIGGGFFSEGVTEDGFISDMEALGDIDNVEVHISSKGGSVSVGLGIFNYLTQHKAHVKTVVYSEASSIASVIALAGDERVMLEGTTMYVHEPLTGVQGYAADLFKTADYLVTVKNNILDIYERVTGQARASLEDLMKNETMMNAQEALRRGFITAIEVPETPIANMMGNDEFATLMIKEAEMTVKDQKIKDLEAELLALKNEAPEETTEEVVEEVAETEQESEAVEQEAQAMYESEIKAVCAAAKMPEVASDYIAAKTEVSQVRSDLFSMLTAGDEEINNAAPVAIVETETTRNVSSKDIYAKRNSK